jgi:hypothetical protein
MKKGNNMARKFTYKVLELMDAGMFEPTWLAEQLASWCSEDDMKKFYYSQIADMVEEFEDFITE